MTSYLKSEFYRILHNMKSYLFIGICSLLLISSNVILAIVKYSDSTFKYANTDFAIRNYCGSIIFVFFLCVMVASMIFGNEHNNHTMKNSISYGISRGVIYFSKLIVEIVYSIAALIIITGMHIGSAYLLLENSSPRSLELLARACFVSIPLFLFVLATTNCFAFIIESSGAGFAATSGLIIALPIASNFLGMRFASIKKFAEILPLNLVNSIGINGTDYYIDLPWDGNAGYYNYWLAGLIQMVIIMLIGYVVFRKKEIK